MRSDATGDVLRGYSTITHVAPGLFTLDASGSGPGAVLKAVTFALEPFSVETDENPGVDKRTRLTIFGTGLRYAGNPTHDPFRANVTASVQVEAQDLPGELWSLDVQYAGGVPGFWGLDQVNVALPPEMDGTGLTEITLNAESTISNWVTTTI